MNKTQVMLLGVASLAVVLYFVNISGALASNIVFLWALPFAMLMASVSFAIGLKNASQKKHKYLNGAMLVVSVIGFVVLCVFAVLLNAMAKNFYH